MDIFSDFWYTNFQSDVVDIDTFVDVFSAEEIKILGNVEENSWKVFSKYFAQNGKINIKDFDGYHIKTVGDFMYLKISFYEVMKQPGYVNIDKKISLSPYEYIIKPYNGYFAILIGDIVYPIKAISNEQYLQGYEYKIGNIGPMESVADLIYLFLHKMGDPEPHFIPYKKEKVNIDYDFMDSEFVNVVIKLNDGEIEINKALLTGSSEHFKTTFSLPFIESKMNQLKLDENYSNFVLLIDFIKNNNVFFDLNEEEKYNLVYLASYYEININIDNLASYLNIGDIENFPELVNLLLFNNISPDVIASMINENTNIEGIEEIYLPDIANSRYLKIRNFKSNTNTVNILLKYIK